MIRRLLITLSALLFACTVAVAQFADQATFAGTGAGSANVQTLTLPNASSLADIQGVLIKYIPGATNTSAATLTVGNGSSTFAATAIRKLTGSGLTALTGSEIVTGQAVMVMYDGTFFDIMSGESTQTTASSLATSALAFDVPTNLRINAVVGTNALTLSLVANNNSDASAGNPILTLFRDSTIGNGGPVLLSLQAALNFTIASTNTMGCVSAVVCRLWIVEANNGGTAVLCAYNALSGFSIVGINEGILWTSNGSTTGGSSAQTLYCGTAITSKSIRILGYIEITETVAGTWATLPTFIQLMGPGIKKPGETVQIVRAGNGNATTTANHYTLSDTAPTNSQGTTPYNTPIVPTSAANLVHITANLQVAIDTGATAVAWIWNTTTSANLATEGVNIPNTNGTATLNLNVWTQPAVTTSVTYSLYGAADAGTLTINGISTRRFGGTSNSFIQAEEVQGALPEPANDNGTFNQRMVG